MKHNVIEQWKSEGYFINIQQHQIFYLDYGNADATKEKTMVLLHGFPESSFNYRGVIEDLLQIFDRIILMDFIGFGFSDKPTSDFGYSIFEHTDSLLSFLNKKQIYGAHLLAHDMGCSILTEIVHRENQNLLHDFDIQSTCFTNSGFVISKVKITLGQKLLLSPIGKYFTRISNQIIFSNQIKSASKNDGLKAEDIEHLWEILCINDGNKKMHLLARYYKDRIVYWDFRWLQALRETKKPLYFFWGMQDKVGNSEVLDYVKETVKNAQIKEDQNLGHFCQLENPTAWAKAIRSFY